MVQRQLSWLRSRGDWTGLPFKAAHLGCLLQQGSCQQLLGHGIAAACGLHAAHKVLQLLHSHALQLLPQRLRLARPAQHSVQWLSAAAGSRQHSLGTVTEAAAALYPMQLTPSPNGHKAVHTRPT